MAEPSNVVYPVPIRPDLIVRIHNLPDDLTKEEAEKIAAVIRALAEHPTAGVRGLDGGNADGR